MGRYFSKNPYAAIDESGPEPNLHIVRLHVRQPGGSFGVITGEIVHQLRSALDCAVGQLIEIGTGARPTADHNFEFPIFNDATKYTEKVRKKKIGGVPDHAAAVIDAVQPFQSEHGQTIERCGFCTGSTSRTNIGR
jgi:hypothetical protein